MAARIDAYVDTSAFIAFMDISDSHHALFRRLFAAPPNVVVTSSLVVVEGHAWFLQRFDRERALQFLAMIEDMPFLDVRPIGTPDLQGATTMLRRFDDQDLTLVDSVGLHLMGDGRARECWSTDRHLGLTGVPLAIHAA
ncbi:MAG: PIN domain-containing protein [Trueperaceae bacterium]|nr:PIN domain-containing protein [Trueperaceae bacterium]